MSCTTLIGHSRPDPFRPSALHVLVADDHEMVRAALKHALAPLAAEIVWREASDAQGTETALSLLGALDLALVDLHMPGGGVGWVAGLHLRFPAVPLIVLTGDESPGLADQLIAAGVAGYIPKSDSAAVILHAVQLVLSGGTYAPLRFFCATDSRDDTARARQRDRLALTDRQCDVLDLLARGLPNRQIAHGLGLSEGTVKAHLLAIFRALAVRNRTEAVVAARKRLRVDGRLQAEAPGAPGNQRSLLAP